MRCFAYVRQLDDALLHHLPPPPLDSDLRLCNIRLDHRRKSVQNARDEVNKATVE